MAVLRTDDAARRLDFPVGPPLLKAPFPVWAVFLAVSILGWTVAGLCVSAIGPVPLLVLLAALTPPVPALLAALISKRWINRVTPLRYHLKTLQNEVHAPRPQPADLPPRRTAVPAALFTDAPRSRT